MCIPAYNEADIIADSVLRVREALGELGLAGTRIIVADNGSTDGTAGIVRALALPDVEVLEVPMKGKGAAIAAAARRSEAELFGFIDADLSADPKHISSLVSALRQGAHIAVASRLHPDAKTDRGFSRTLSSRAFNLLRRGLVGIDLYDSQCGLKVTTREGRAYLLASVETGWFFEVEWLARATRAGLTITEVPIDWMEFRYPDRKSKLKVLKDGFGALAAFRRINKRVRSE